MEFGITIPLQKFLKRQAPSYGTQQELFFCWDLHVIRYHGKDTLVAVNASNCFTSVMWDMGEEDWNMLEVRGEEAIRTSLLAAGYTGEQVDRYIRAAGPARITKTHGRKPVAGLNRMIEFLRFAPASPDTGEMYQALQCRFVNSNTCRAAGFGTPGAPEIFLEADMVRCGIVERTEAAGAGTEEAPETTDMPQSCPCRRKCPRKGDCQACLQFHSEQKAGIPVACRRKK